MLTMCAFASRLSNRQDSGGSCRNPADCSKLACPQVFYGILVQHFANLASQAEMPMAAIDVVTRQLLELTGEVPFYAATVARARLAKAHQRLQSALFSPDAAQTGGWPGELLLQAFNSMLQQMSHDYYIYYI